MEEEEESESMGVGISRGINNHKLKKQGFWARPVNF